MPTRSSKVKGKVTVRPASQRPAPLNLGQPKGVSTQASAGYVPRDVQQPEPVDIGSPANINSPLAVSARGSAVQAANMRQGLRAPDARRVRPDSERAIPASELETRPPVSLGRPPALRFPTDGNFARQPEPEDAVDAMEQTEFVPYQEPYQEPFQGADPFSARIRQLQGGGASVTPLSVPQRSSLGLESLKVEDVDQLWDWIRTEPDRAAPFFGEHIASALALHMKMQKLMNAQQTGTTIVRAIVYQQQLLGVGVVHPIDVTNRVANLHLYVAPPYRQHLPQLLPELIHAADELLPKGLKLAIYADRPGWVELLTPLGFVAHTLLILER